MIFIGLINPGQGSNQGRPAHLLVSMHWARPPALGELQLWLDLLP